MRIVEHRRFLEENRRQGPLLRMEELTLEEKTVIHSDYMSRVRKNRAADIWEMWVLYVETLHSWGVICPHPQNFRLYDGLYESDMPQSFEDTHWYHCRLCQAAVINR